MLDWLRLAVALLLVALSVVDILERRVPRAGQWLLAFLVVLDVFWVVGGPTVGEAILGILLAGGMGMALYMGGRWYAAWRALPVVAFGQGDVWVLAFVGGSLGVASVPALLLRSILLGGLLALMLLLLRWVRGQPYRPSLTMPYLPAIALAAGSLFFGPS